MYNYERAGIRQNEVDINHLYLYFSEIENKFLESALENCTSHFTAKI